MFMMNTRGTKQNSNKVIFDMELYGWLSKQELMLVLQPFLA